MNRRVTYVGSVKLKGLLLWANDLANATINAVQLINIHFSVVREIQGSGNRTDVETVLTTFRAFFTIYPKVPVKYFFYMNGAFRALHFTQPTTRAKVFFYVHRNCKVFFVRSGRYVCNFFSVKSVYADLDEV